MTAVSVDRMFMLMSICIRDDKIELNLCYLTSTSKSTPIRFEIYTITHCAEEGFMETSNTAPPLPSPYAHSLHPVPGTCPPTACLITVTFLDFTDAAL